MVAGGLELGRVEHALHLTPNPIVLENRHPGTTAWQIGRHGYRVANDRQQQIKGYASATSVNEGARITFYVTVYPRQTYTLSIYRIGWYGGKGGRFMRRVGPFRGVVQPPCPVRPRTGLIECRWHPSYTLLVPRDWTTGIYLGVLTNAHRYQNYVVFAVRDDGDRAPILFQQAVTTYQAYNDYPDDGRTGKSLYDRNDGRADSYGVDTIAGNQRAVEVSFDRPYADDGSGQFLWYEINFVRWLERNGYDVDYQTDVDTDLRPQLLLRHRAFVSVGHDEYWTMRMREAVVRARSYGVNLAFFGGNDMYRQFRFLPSPEGVRDRIMLDYKNARLDPVHGRTTTVNWRQPPVNMPEQTVLGIQYRSLFPMVHHEEHFFRPSGTYVVRDASSWVYAGTGFHDGSRVRGLVGYEFDGYQPRYPLPPHVSYHLLSRSRVEPRPGHFMYANSCIYQAPSGAWVFDAGTIQWGWGLDDYGHHGIVDWRIQRTTANILDRFIGWS